MILTSSVRDAGRLTTSSEVQLMNVSASTDVVRSGRLTVFSVVVLPKTPSRSLVSTSGAVPPSS